MKQSSQEEVVVHGQRSVTGAMTMTGAEARQIPGALGDPFRAIEALPGVTPVASGVPYFFVRGAPPGNIGYYLDGVRVPLLYHIGLGPAVVHPGLIDHVDFYPGASPAGYGRFAGAIVAGELTPEQRTLHGEVNLRLVDAGTLVEGPILDGRGSVMVAGRYSFVGPVLSHFSPETQLAYWDYQARASVDLTNHDRLSVFAFGSSDYLASRVSDRPIVLTDTSFHRLDLRYDRDLGAGGKLRYAVTLGVDRSAGDTSYVTSLGSNSDSAEGARVVQTRMLATRVEAQSGAGEVVFRGGGSAELDAYAAEAPALPDVANARDYLASTFRSRNDIALAAWTDAVIKMWTGVEVTPGVRAELYGSDGATAVAIEPRISLRYQATSRLSFQHALGAAYQPPSFLGPIPGLQVAGLRGGLQRSLLGSFGAEVQVTEGTTAGGTVYHNIYSNMSDVLGTRTQQIAGFERRSEARSNGVGNGLELWLRRSLTRQLGGFVSYTLSRSTRSLGRESFLFGFDRTHVLSAALGYDLGRHWRAGARLVYYTGRPLTPELDPTGRPYELPARSPSFTRLDLRVEKRWNLGENGALSLVFEIQNATFSKEVIDYSCTTGPGCDPKEFGPVTLPNIGLEARL